MCQELAIILKFLFVLENLAVLYSQEETFFFFCESIKMEALFIIDTFTLTISKEAKASC